MSGSIDWKIDSTSDIEVDTEDSMEFSYIDLDTTMESNDNELDFTMASDNTISNLQADMELEWIDVEEDNDSDKAISNLQPDMESEWHDVEEDNDSDNVISNLQAQADMESEWIDVEGDNDSDKAISNLQPDMESEWIDVEADNKSSENFQSNVENDAETEWIDIEDNDDVESHILLEDDSELEENIEDVEAYVATLNFKLRKWAVTHNITLMALTSLLQILKEYGHISLPKDARTLLRTPKTVKSFAIGSGRMWYRGLTKKLSDICKLKKCTDDLKLELHMDGLPIYKSSTFEMWPIQCSIKGIKMRPFFAGLHCGASKPQSLESFLRPLISELQHLLKSGLPVVIDGIKKTFNVMIDKIILDAPARAYIKCIKGHSGYFSCERCGEEGVYLFKTGETVSKRNTKKRATKRITVQRKGHVCLVGTNATLRTDSTFRTQQQEEHHTGKSPMEDLPIDMIRAFPLEYLHLILHGAMKRLLTLWVTGTKNFKTKFSATQITEISKLLLESGKSKPAEINRPNRSLNVLSFWKATELRTFLLKTGPVVLRKVLPVDAYNHFLALHCAVTICCSKALRPYLNIAKFLFTQFVTKFGEIYGEENLTYCLHSLIHVTDDVEEFGPLDLYSAFAGESNLGFLKRLVRGGYKPLQQVVKRIYEREAVERIEHLLELKVPKKLGLHKNILHLEELRLDCSDKNRWILTKEKDIFKINNFSTENDKIQIHGTTLLRKNQKNLYETPITSKDVFAYRTKLDENEEKIINLDDMFCKLYRLNFSHEESAFFPLLHTT